MASGPGIFCLNNPDLLVQILKRLPPKTLCKFRSVCKWWYSLISSSLFITGHHLAFNHNDDVAAKSYLVSSSCFINHTSSYAVYTPQLSLADYPPKFLPIPFKTSLSLDKFIVVDVVSGVICVVHPHSPQSIIAWNPTIHKFAEIPPSPFLPPSSSSHVLGFGFHSGEFKVVRICGFYPPRGLMGETYQRYQVRPREALQPPTYEVFSTRQGCWREAFAGHMDPCALLSYSGCFANGSIHWIISIYNNNNYDDYRLMVLVFDCEREELKTMELPREFNERLAVLPRLFTYRGLLSVLTTTADSNQVYEKWSMEEYGVPSSWKKLSMTDPDEDFAMIVEHGVYHFRGSGLPMRGWWWSSRTVKELRVKQPLMGHVLEESMFLMDAKTQSYT